MIDTLSTTSNGRSLRTLRRLIAVALALTLALQLGWANDAETVVASAAVSEILPKNSFRRPQFIRGDLNGDGLVNISDPVREIVYLFDNDAVIPCMAAGDANADGKLDISDPTAILEFLFVSGKPLPAPGPFRCGVQSTDKGLSCDSYKPCPDDFPLIGHVLNRITFGPTEELYSRIQTRHDLVQYIEEQLNAPENYNQALHEPELHQEIEALNIGFRGYDTATNQTEQLKALLLVNAVKSKWQLLHVVSQFWNNHFHTQIDALRKNFFARGHRGGATVMSSELIFRRADANGDEVLTDAEWETFRAHHSSAVPFELFGWGARDCALSLEEFLKRSYVGYWKYARSNEQFAVAAELEKREYELYRRLAFGKFGNVLEACAKSPAMLMYLNTFENTAQAPNENYAREFLELFGLGVDHVYTQRDIEELSKVFTGWTVGWVPRALYQPSDINFQNRPGAPDFNIGERTDLQFPKTENWRDDTFTWGFIFRNSTAHDWGRKDLFLPSHGGVDSLGRTASPLDAVHIPDNPSDHSVAAAMEEFNLVLDRVTHFRDCAKFISTKLIQLLVTDDLSKLSKSYPMPPELRASFKRVDLNGDNLLAPQEWEKPVNSGLPNGRPWEVFLSLDTNRDGFVSLREYQEPDLLLDSIEAWQQSGGNMREVLRTILYSDEFLSLKFYRAKVKTPFVLATSAVRVLGGDFAAEQLLRTTHDLSLAGMQLFNFSDPTGESILGFDLMDTTALLERLKFLNRGVNPVRQEERRFNWSPDGLDHQWNLTDSSKRAVDFLILLLHNGDLPEHHRSLALRTYDQADAGNRLQATTAFLLCLPQFQKQ